MSALGPHDDWFALGPSEVASDKRLVAAQIEAERRLVGTPVIIAPSERAPSAALDVAVLVAGCVLFAAVGFLVGVWLVWTVQAL